MNAKAKRGDVCVVKVLDYLGRARHYSLARVLRTTRAGDVTHVDPYGELGKANGGSTLSFHMVAKSDVWKCSGPEGARIAEKAVFPKQWATLEEARAEIASWLD